MSRNYEQLGLTQSDYQAIVRLQGREPTAVELALFGATWGGPCSRQAAIVDAGGGWALAVKMDGSSRACSAEPGGGALAVAGAVRALVSVGARPLANLICLRFGEAGPEYEQALADISDYAGGSGIPVLDGEVRFEDAYREDCLVHCLSVGVMKCDELMRAEAGRPGDLLLRLDAEPRDGSGRPAAPAGREVDQVHGSEHRSAPPPAHPGERSLLECCLELLRGGMLKSLQALGEGGLVAAVGKLAAGSGAGLEVWAMVNPSRARMLAVAEPQHRDQVSEVCGRWGVGCTQLGVVSGDGRVRILHDGAVLADVAATVLAEAPAYAPTPGLPIDQCGGGVSLAAYPPPAATSGEILLDLLGSPSIAGRQWLRRRLVNQLPECAAPLGGAGAALLPVEAMGAGLALSAGGNGRRAQLDPYRGAKEAVAEAARRISCLGATPMTVAACLHVGRLSGLIEGVAEACQALGAPVVSAGAPLCPRHSGEAAFPTPVIGMLGMLREGLRPGQPHFREVGDLVVLLGDALPQIDGSEYQKRWYGRLEGIIPDVDLRPEVRLQEVVREAVRSGLSRSAHDCCSGGVGVALAECCLGGLGARLNLDRLPGADTYQGDVRTDVALFGEAATRVLLSLSPDRLGDLEELCAAKEVPLLVLGNVGGDNLTFEIRGEQVGVPVSALVDTYESGLSRTAGSSQARG